MAKLSHSSQMDRRRKVGEGGGSQNSARDLPGEAGEEEEDDDDKRKAVVDFFTPRHLSPPPPFIGGCLCVCVFEGAAGGVRRGDEEGRGGHKRRMWQRFQQVFLLLFLSPGG